MFYARGCILNSTAIQHSNQTRTFDNRARVRFVLALHYAFLLMLFMFVLVVVRAPRSWHKMSGHVPLEWVGYLLDMGRF